MKYRLDISTAQNTWPCGSSWCVVWMNVKFAHFSFLESCCALSPMVNPSKYLQEGHVLMKPLWDWDLPTYLVHFRHNQHYCESNSLPIKCGLQQWPLTDSKKYLNLRVTLLGDKIEFNHTFNIFKVFLRWHLCKTKGAVMQDYFDVFHSYYKAQDLYRYNSLLKVSGIIIYYPDFHILTFFQANCMASSSELP